MAVNKPSRKKIAFPVGDNLLQYLSKYNIRAKLPITYKELDSRQLATVALLKQDGQDTFWRTVYFNEYDTPEINNSLCLIYALLKTDGDTKVIEHLEVARIDYCTFGNTKPYRIRIINKLNDNYDHFYIKQIDASRIYGLELEHLLSPSSLSYLVDETTLIEEHIAGIPGDDFMLAYLETSQFNQIRIAKEFVKFNERCFVRLLGDMRSYNYIIDITPDIEGLQYRIRAIDFDQQSYEGWKTFYLPQYFKENNPIINIGLNHLTPETVTQYQLEERSLIANRAKAEKDRLSNLLDIMAKDALSSPEKIKSIKEQLSIHHNTNRFDSCQTMGEIVRVNIELVLDKTFRQSMSSK